MFLSLDTSGNVPSICIFTKDSFLYKESTKPNSEEIVEMTTLLLQENNIKPNQIKAIFTSLGPGSFTGIKTCLGFAKVFGYAINCNVYGFNSLHTVAIDFKEKNPLYTGNIASTINAFGNSVYMQVFNNNLNQKGNILHLSIEDAKKQIQELKNTSLAGYIEESEKGKAYPNAYAIAKLALKYEKNLSDFTNLTPFYMQNPYKPLKK